MGGWAAGLVGVGGRRVVSGCMGRTGGGGIRWVGEQLFPFPLHYLLLNFLVLFSNQRRQGSQGSHTVQKWFL